MKHFLFLIFSIILFLISTNCCFGQGYNHTWLLGYHYNATYPESRLNFTSSSYSIISENRALEFESTEANISDSTGNLIISTNGRWIANANNDTMQNGTNLNPGVFASTYGIRGMPIEYGNIIVPSPIDSSQYILFHQTALNNGIDYPSTELLYTTIDIDLDSGLGAVISKNDTVIIDKISWGISACKHSNGRDWWIIALKDSTDIIYKILLTPQGFSSITIQNLNVSPFPWGNITQPTFSPDGKKFSYSTAYSINGVYFHDVRLFNFDRCNGTFSNPILIDISDSLAGIGLALSATSQYLYACSFRQIFQIDTDAPNIALSVQIVAQNDTFQSPFPWCCTTDFWAMYLAADSKIYIATGNGTDRLHVINNPDSSGLACDVQQHIIQIPSFNIRTVPNHPNYYLGCDPTSSCPCLTEINNIQQHNFKFSLSPNPSNGEIKIMYLLPQNKSGTFQILDITGKQVFKTNLPQWSSLQNFDLSFLENGIYQCVIRSDNISLTKKLLILK